MLKEETKASFLIYGPEQLKTAFVVSVASAVSKRRNTKGMERSSLKARNPNNKIKPPNPANGTECPGIWSCEEVPNLPSLGPMKKHPTSAQVPPST